MPANRKPRKRMRRSFERTVIRMDDQAIAQVTEMFERTYLAVALKLHLGLCDFEDMACMRDMYNLVTAVLTLRGQLFDDEFRADAVRTVVEEGFTAWCEVYTRGKATDHYICTAKQLQAIRASFEFIEAIVADSLEHQPVQLMREWFGVQLLMRRQQHGRFHVTVGALRKAVQEACIDEASAVYYMRKYRVKCLPIPRLNTTEEEK